MAGGIHDSSLTRVRPFFSALVARDPTGSEWLGPLLTASPRGQALLDELDGDPGTLEVELTRVGKHGLLGCFEYPSQHRKSCSPGS